MEAVLSEFFSGILKELADHLLAYLGIGAAAVAATAGVSYAVNLRYKKSVTQSESKQENSGSISASDDVINGNQTLINNYYLAQSLAREKEKEVAEYQKTPVPSELVQKVENLPVADRHMAQENYVGKNFQWNVKFHKLKKKGEGDQFRVFFSDPDEFGKPMIYCDLSLKDHPGLKNLSEGENLKVAGKLACFSGHEMNLDLDKVIYPPEKRI